MLKQPFSPLITSSPFYFLASPYDKEDEEETRTKKRPSIRRYQSPSHGFPTTLFLNLSSSSSFSLSSSSSSSSEDLEDDEDDLDNTNNNNNDCPQEILKNQQDDENDEDSIMLLDLPPLVIIPPSQQEDDAEDASTGDCSSLPSWTMSPQKSNQKTMTNTWASSPQRKYKKYPLVYKQQVASSSTTTTTRRPLQSALAKMQSSSSSISSQRTKTTVSSSESFTLSSSSSSRSFAPCSSSSTSCCANNNKDSHPSKPSSTEKPSSFCCSTCSYKDEIIQRQSDEISFLRSTLKDLVHLPNTTFGHNNTTTPTSSSSSSSHRVRNHKTCIKGLPAKYSGPILRKEDNDDRTILPHGSGGVIRFENGDLYLGQVQYGTMHGIGMYYRKSCATPLKGRFECNEYIP